VPGQEGPSLPILDEDDPDEEKSKTVAESEEVENDKGCVDASQIRNGSNSGPVFRQLTVEETRQEAAKRMSKYSNPEP
jgi:hypothetical protein